MLESLRRRLTAGFLLLTAVPLLTVVAVTGYRSTDSLERQSLSLAREVSARVGSDITAFIAQRISELRLLDHLTGLATLGPAAQRSALSSLLMWKQDYQEFALLDESGQEQIRLSRTDVILPSELANRRRANEYLVAFENRQIYYGPVWFDSALREPLFKVALPVVDRRTDQIRYVLVAEIRFKKIWDLLAEIDLPEATDLYVANSSGLVVAHKNPATVLAGTRLSLSETSGRIRNLNGEDAVVVSLPLAIGRPPLTVVAMQPATHALRLASGNLWLTLVITLTALLFAVLAGTVLARQLVEPVERLADAARAVSDGDLSVQVTPEGSKEIRALGGAFEQMTRRLRGIVEELKKAESAATAQSQVTLESIGDAVITTDTEGSVKYLNPVAQTLTAWTLDDALGQPLEKVFHIVNEHDRKRAANPVARCLSEGKVVDLANHTVLIDRRGREYAIQDSAAPIRDRAGTLLGVVLVFSDVTEARRLQREILHQATHDELTGLVNRREFENRLERVLESVKSGNAEHALCYLDLDQFKIVNDTCGHAAGDELLRQVAALFRKRVRKRDTLGRLGGDEFAVLMEHCTSDQAHRVADSLRRAVEGFRFGWHAKTFSIGVSIGLVPIDAASGSATAVLSAADSACYVAKDTGRNRIHVYHEKDAALAHRHSEMQWVTVISRALEEDRFRLYAQPVCPIGRQTRHAGHYELLLRLIDDRGKEVLPGAFLPSAERYNLAIRIDRWVVAAAFHWLAKQPLERAPAMYAINLSGHSLGDDDFLAYVHRQLDETGVPPERLCFEITETAAVANFASATRFINMLRKRGCRFALDDFGSGLSSFAYLKALPVDYLKIDGGFVKDITDDPLDLAIVRSINEIAQLLGMRTIAEFVESDAILRRLHELGVDYAQGYAVGKPHPLRRTAVAERRLEGLG